MGSLHSIAAPTPRPIADSWWRARYVGAALVALATCVAYWPARDGGFVLDDDLLLQNELVKDPAGLYRIWFTTDAVDYWPVSNTLFWIEWRLWGTDPRGYHVVNVALHIVAALLAWTVLRRLSIPGAFLAGLLFAVHPVNVESVAWISQLKTILAGVFFLLSIDCYLRAEASNSAGPQPLLSGRWYWLSLAAFVLGMLSKASIAMLPLVLLLIAWWKCGAITRRDVARTAPFFLVAVPLILVNLWFRHHGVDQVIRTATFVERLLGAGLVPWFYLSKALWPLGLIFIYPMWQIDVGNPLWWLPLAATVGATLALVWQRHTGWGRALLFAWAFYLLALAPVMGFADVTYMKWSLVADHYQYVAILAVVAVVAAALALLWERCAAGLFLRIAVSFAMPALVGGLMLITRQLSATYRDAITLYGVTVTRNPACWMAYNNLGLALNEAKRPEDAIGSYEEALRWHPDFPEAHNNLGIAIYLTGRTQEAIAHFREALRLRPDYPDPYYNLAKDRVNAGRPQEAIEYYQQAIQRRPTYTEAHNDLGLLLLGAGQGEQALEHLREAARLKPNDAGIQNSLGAALLNLGQAETAIGHFERAVQLRPKYALAEQNWGNALLRSGQTLPAIQHYERAVKLDPSVVEARTILGSTLLSAGRVPEAVEQFRQVVVLEPQNPQAHNNLGAALLAANQPPDAAASLQRAVGLAPDYLEAWTSLAVANQRAQRPAEAITAAERALELARARGNAGLAEQLSALLRSLRPGQGQDSNTVPSPALPPAR